MNNKNLNCHPERVEGSQLNCCFRSQPPEAKTNQVEPGDPEGSQQNYISLRDIAENAKLNHEIAEELRKYQNNHQLSCQCSTLASRWLRNPYLTWILRSSRSMTRMYVLLSIITLLPTLAQAEQCTATPDCKSLGYTETSCPDGGGVKCPWNTNLMYCCKKCAPSCEVKNSCQIGDILYSDKKCYTCPNAYTLPGRAPIGVVFSSGKAVALTDLNQKMSWDLAKSACRSYSVEGVSGWHLPSKDELLAMYNNRSSVVQGFSNAIGGKDFVSSWYWSSSYYGYYDSGDHYYVFDPVRDSTNDFYYDYNLYVRPVLSF